MSEELNEFVNDIHQGDAYNLVEKLPADSIDCVVTSPPYWGLRDYDSESQMGLEETLHGYIDRIVEMGKQLQRVVRDDGVWWLNLGDVFLRDTLEEGETTLPEKSKALLPHRVAIALNESGWRVRSDVVWSKPNPMPHSVGDRLNEEKEFLFQLVQAKDYWFNLDSIREPYAESSIERINSDAPILNRATERYANSTPISGGANDSREIHPEGKNPGDVWEETVPTLSEGHFAVYPEGLVEKPIKSTCPPEVCANCGKPYEQEEAGGEWQKSCTCNTGNSVPGVVLDPFAGSGTTAIVAKRLNRRFIGFELNPDYVAIAQKRVGVSVDEPERLSDDEEETRLSDFE